MSTLRRADVSKNKKVKRKSHVISSGLLGKKRHEVKRDKKRPGGQSRQKPYLQERGGGRGEVKNASFRHAAGVSQGKRIQSSTVSKATQDQAKIENGRTKTLVSQIPGRKSSGRKMGSSDFPFNLFVCAKGTGRHFARGATWAAAGFFDFPLKTPTQPELFL